MIDLYAAIYGTYWHEWAERMKLYSRNPRDWALTDRKDWISKESDVNGVLYSEIK